MNKTISINLGGRVFNIEEDAFRILHQYLESIRQNFTSDPDINEIMADIESRIAEIFAEKNNDFKNVITPMDVEAMIVVMGKPEDYNVAGETSDKESASDQKIYSGTRNKRRKIFRDTDDALVAGVCSGLSHYFKTDPLVIRLIFVVLTLASIGFPGVLGYIIFWALVPAATTTADKLQMRGEHVNIENIGRFVKDEARSAADRVSNFGKSTAHNIQNGSVPVLSAIGRIFRILFGIAFFMIGIGLLIGLVSMMAFSDFTFYGFETNSWEKANTLLFANDGTMYVLIIGILLAIGAPAIGLLYNGIKMMTGINRKIKALGISLFSLFIIGILMCVYGGVKTAKEFGPDAEITQTFVLDTPTSDTLHIALFEDTIFPGRNAHNNNLSNLLKFQGERIYYGQSIHMEFEPSDSRQQRVIVKKKSRGVNFETAGLLARNINYTVDAENDSVTLAPFFSTPKNDLYRGQEIEILFEVPIGNSIEFGKNTSLFCWQAEETKLMIMTEDGLEEAKPVRPIRHKNVSE